MSAKTLVGKYLGIKKVREDRQGELSLKERKELQKARPDIDLELRPDGTFRRQATEGKWCIDGDLLLFRPVSFGGHTLDEMRKRAEEMGRMFNLAFVFNPFELRCERDTLVTSDAQAVVYVEFRRYG